ncbi:cilia- and flagella-associated protein 251 isoform X3 [Antennarius striatus]|uniref:cilia- and flagella-associated protein 251 isoform X3 n=1 Tax=Antennarius striatus TaxID=241820 RepID=UPI0035ADEBFE
MDKSFADIRTDAFSASFPDGDFDFKNLSLDVKFEAEFSNENIPTEEDETQHQEAVLFSTETKDVPTAENIAKEPLNEDDFQQEEAKNLEKTPENDCKGWDGNSEQDISLSGEDEEDDEEDMVKGEEPRQLFTVCCNSRSCNHNKPDRFLTEGQTLDPISSKDLQVRNKEQRDNETDENVTYFGRLPDCGSEMVIKADENDEEKHECKGEKQEGLSDRQQEDTEMKQEESISDGYFREEIYNSCIDGPVKASLEIPEKPLQNQMDLMSENEEKYLEKMKDFSGEEHQEAEKVSASLVVERFDARSSNPSNLGSLDDSFFYGTEFEASGISELGQLEDEDFEDESYWKQEQERITAFHRIYYESGRGDRKERRQIKVPFCADPLSQVIYYDSDSSDRDSFSSSTSGEEDVSSAETSEVLTLAQKLKWHGESKESKTCCELPKIQLPENKEKQDLINKQNCRSKQNCLNMLKVTLKMVLVAVMGLMIFWLVTVESRWLSQILFF